jgi:prolyl 4-hydroxylase
MESDFVVLVISIDSYIFYILFIAFIILCFFILYPSYICSPCSTPPIISPVNTSDIIDLTDTMTDEEIGHPSCSSNQDNDDHRIGFTVGELVEEPIESAVTTEITDSSGRRIIKHTFGDYELQEIYGIFTKDECDRMIALGKEKGMEQSEVSSYDKNETKIDTTSRISSQAWLPDSYDEVIERFAEFTAGLTGLPIDNQEEVQIAAYEVGGKFLEHFDACREDPGYEYCLSANGTAGERVATLLVYLNDDFEGGQTIFPELDLKITPEKGKGILFYNIDENQKPLPKSLHMGAEVLKGEKWIATKWVHVDDFKNKIVTKHQE